MNGLTNATSQDTAWCPKHQIVKSVLSVRRHYPKRGRFTENLSIYLSSPAPNSLLQNSSNFGATAYHWLLYILFFFFLILTGWMRGALGVATHLYILYLAADESISGWEFFLLIPKLPQYIATRKAELGGFLEKMNICKGVTALFKKFLNWKNYYFFFFLVCPANPLFFAKRLYWFLIVLFSRRIIYQILVSYLQMFNNFGNLFRWLEN